MLEGVTKKVHIKHVDLQKKCSYVLLIHKILPRNNKNYLLAPMNQFSTIQTELFKI